MKDSQRPYRTDYRKARITLIVGKRGAGKTTLATLLQSKTGGQVIDDYRPGDHSRTPNKTAFRALIESETDIYICAEDNCRPYSFPPNRIITISL